MKIALIKSTLKKKGGLEKYTFRLAQGFAEQGHEVVVLTTDCTLTSDLFHVVNLGKRARSSFFLPHYFLTISYQAKPKHFLPPHFFSKRVVGIALK